MLRFVGNGDKKSHQKSPPFFNAKFPGKFEEKIQKTSMLIIIQAAPRDAKCRRRVVGGGTEQQGPRPEVKKAR